MKMITPESKTVLRSRGAEPGRLTSCAMAIRIASRDGGVPAASSSVPNGAAAGSMLPILSPVRPESISWRRRAVVGGRLIWRHLTSHVSGFFRPGGAGTWTSAATVTFAEAFAALALAARIPRPVLARHAGAPFAWERRVGFATLPVRPMNATYSAAILVSHDGHYCCFGASSRDGTLAVGGLSEARF